MERRLRRPSTLEGRSLKHGCESECPPPHFVNYGMFTCFNVNQSFYRTSTLQHPAEARICTQRCLSTPDLGIFKRIPNCSLITLVPLSSLSAVSDRCTKGNAR